MFVNTSLPRRQRPVYRDSGRRHPGRWRLAANLDAAKRLDLCICDDRGIEQIRLTDIPFNSAAGSVAFQQPITYAKAAPSETLIARLVALDDSGRERLLGEYTFNHPRTLPGPGAW